MNKRDRKNCLKDIAKLIEEYINTFVGVKNILGTAIDKIEDLDNYFENNCIMPNDWDIYNLKQQMLKDYFENDNDIEEIVGLIENLREEIREYIDEMSENATYREEWEEFYDNFEYIESYLDIDENEITTIEDYECALEELKNSIEFLI